MTFGLEALEAVVEIDGVTYQGVRDAKYRRGRRDRFGPISPATANVVLAYPAGIPDVIGKPFRLLAQLSNLTFEAVFTGYVTTMAASENAFGADYTLRVTALDESARLGGNIAEVADPVGTAELPGARINRLLDAARIPVGDRLIGPGRTPLVGTNLGSDLKSEADAAAGSDLGAYFVSRDGIHVFYDSTQWHETPVPAATLLVDNAPGSANPYQTYKIGRSARWIANIVTASGPGYASHVEDQASIDQYGAQLIGYSAPTHDPLTLDWIASNVLENSKASAVEAEAFEFRSARASTYVHDTCVVLDVGDRLIAKVNTPPDGTGNVFDLDQAVTGVEGQYRPASGWRFYVTGHERLTIVPRYDPILIPPWNRYYMADGPRALERPNSQIWEVWIDERNQPTELGLDPPSSGVPRHVFEESDVLGGRRVVRRDNDSTRETLQDKDNIDAANTPFPATAVGVFGFDVIPRKNNADLSGVTMLAGIEGTPTNYIEVGLSVVYSGQAPSELEFHYRSHGNGSWTQVSGGIPLVTDASVGVLIEFGPRSNGEFYMRYYNSVDKSWTNLSLGLATNWTQPIEFLVLGDLWSAGQDIWSCGTLAIATGDQAENPSAEFTEWEDWAISSYGFDL